ncbi:NAD-P-binding protein [Artomyces pyxidatus]|uniref:NAD-P-binding protein n=1 Tax=Artomyces pyxidatus TaxID=48021 RepID=A0ACB8TGC5_9AGAM|nr:NAD-P-binding protein [Artomyces pyxidatus]
MSGYKNFAVVGAGKVGSFVLEEILEAKEDGAVDRVMILTRQESVSKESTQKFVARGAEVVAVDYADKAALKQVLIGVDAIVSTISLFALDPQATIAEAAFEAGVKLFVPSEYGGVTEGNEALFAGKARLHAKLKEIGIPHLLVYTGPFADYTWAQKVILANSGNMVLDLDIEHGKVAVGGDGNSPITFTARPDIARFLVYALTKLPAERLENNAYEKKTGKKLDVTYRPIPELEAAVADNPYDFASYLHLEWALGRGIVGLPDNELYPGWHPKTVIEILAHSHVG